MQKVRFPSPRKQKYLFPSPQGEGARRADEVREVGVRYYVDFNFLTRFVVYTDNLLEIHKDPRLPYQ
jgi:hypothetical protein